jgi:hypothetical protein
MPQLNSSVSIGCEGRLWSADFFRDVTDGTRDVIALRS